MFFITSSVKNLAIETLIELTSIMLVFSAKFDSKRLVLPFHADRSVNKLNYWIKFKINARLHDAIV